MRVLVEGEAEPGNQEGDGEHDADVKQVDETVEWIPRGIFDTAMAAQSCAAIHGPVPGGIDGPSCVVVGTCAASACGVGAGI